MWEIQTCVGETQNCVWETHKCVGDTKLRMGVTTNYVWETHNCMLVADALLCERDRIVYRGHRIMR